MSFDLKISQGDLTLDQDGDLEKVEESDKLVQDILKILMTPIGANVFFTWYGSPLSETAVGQVLDRTFVNSVVTQIIRSNLETLQKLQKQQSMGGQRVSANELLAAIQTVNINRNTVDPTYWSIFIQVLTKGLKSRTANLDVTL
jgi:phage baseplate assembly protein W